MSYNKAEESILRVAADAKPDRLRRETMLSLIGAAMVFIGAVAMVLSDPTWRTFQFATLLAASFATVFGYVQFRNRALMLIQKLQSRADSESISAVRR